MTSLENPGLFDWAARARASLAEARKEPLAGIGRLLLLEETREKPCPFAAGPARSVPGTMPGKALRKHGSAPAGADRRLHRARLPRPSPDTSVTAAAHLPPTHTPVVNHRPQAEDQYCRTSVTFPSHSESEAVTECALQLRKIGDKLNLQQRILNLIAKFFCPGSGECLE